MTRQVTIEEEELDQAKNVIYAINDDIPDIVDFYKTRHHLCQDMHHEGKPIFNNRCSKNHQLFNPTIITRERIILNPK